MKNLLIVSLLITLLAACSNNQEELQTAALTDEAELSSLVFGKYYGFCLGDCATLYKVEANTLLIDEINRFMDWESLRFQTKPLSGDRYAVAKTLLNEFPEELLQERQETIGCPNCADQGAFAIEVQQNGETRRWIIDTDRNVLPDYLKAYVDKIDTVMNQLQ
ncbi:MAG: hypothetical protein ACK4TA_25350 [Saprospiraceae bacterium]